MSDILQIIDADGSKTGDAPDLDNQTLIQMFTAIVRTRAFDSRCMNLQRTGKIGFSVPNRGVEATSVGAAAALDTSKDWFAPHYRDFGMLFYNDVPPEAMFDNMFGNNDDSAVGRQMPVHFSFTEPLKWLSISSPLGTQIPQAVGISLASKKRGEDAVALTTFGDGSTSTLGFHSGMNFAGVMKAPTIFLCQNNQWAISCPGHKQTASESYAIKGEAYGVPGVKVDGNDVLAVYTAMTEAVAKARAGEGPTLIEAITFRLGGHSTSDDPTKYVPAEELEAAEANEPLKRFRAYLINEGVLTDESADAIEEQAAAEMLAGARAAEAKGRPVLGTIFTDVWQDQPAHLTQQMEYCIKHYSERDEAVDENGEFPL
jgi:2-oxoisovalerate dehydrogenase E1 component alpha subunit